MFLSLAVVNVYRKSQIYEIFNREKANLTVDAPKPVSRFGFSSTVSDVSVSSDGLVVSIATKDSMLSFVDTRSLDTNPAVFAQTKLTANCKYPSMTHP